MKPVKLYIWAIFLSCLAASSALAVEADFSASKDKNLSEIALEKAAGGNFFTNVVNNIEQKSEAVQKKEAQGYKTSTEKNAIDYPSSLQYIENENNKKLTPVYDLKGGVEKAPEIKQEPLSKELTLLESWAGGDYATGQWFGLRPKLEEHGFTIESSLLNSGFGKTAGGMNEARASRGYSLFNLAVTGDTEKMGLWKGGTFFLLYQRKKGMGLSSEYMGDYQVLDGWDFREMNQISEAWYQHSLFEDKIKMKFGKQDANTDFCALEKGFDFMNTSFSIMPTAPLPTYPDQKFGLMVNLSPKEWLSLKNGIYHKDGGAFNVSEIELKPKIKNLAGRYFTGIWMNSNNLEVTHSMDADGNAITRNFFKNYGCYAAFEQMLFKEKKTDIEDNQGLTVFGQIGLTPSNRNDINRYYGFGLHYKGPIPRRDNDILGAGMAMANFSTRLATINEMVGQETALEFFYKIQISPWLYLQPDVQFIMNGCGANADSVAIGLRSVIKF